MLTIWRFMDGNRAHEKQSAALVSGLRSCLGMDAVDCRDLSCQDLGISLWGALPERLYQLPKPDLVLGAGHRSHWAVLLACRAFGGRSVVILRPSLPLSWFDFVIVPEHDRPPSLPNVILTRGALTEPLPERPFEPRRALLLFGGPSKHFRWDADVVSSAAAHLLQQPWKWVVSDSRRTPEGTLARCVHSGAELHPWQQCPPGWLAEQMASAGQIWVTGDSISMVFEALQSRAQVGVIPLPSRHSRNKIHSAVQRLLDDGMVREWSASHVNNYPENPVQRAPFAQQVSCARALLRRCGWPLPQSSSTGVVF